MCRELKTVSNFSPYALVYSFSSLKGLKNNVRREFGYVAPKILLRTFPNSDTPSSADCNMSPRQCTVIG
jgi:hypothetical protein